jgi:hypothetical protein
MKSPEQIAAAIERLKENRKNTRQFSAFGDNNHEALEYGIETLERNFGEIELYNNLDAELIDQHSFDFAYSLIEWRNGEESIEDYLYPEN